MHLINLLNVLVLRIEEGEAQCALLDSESLCVSENYLYSFMVTDMLPETHA